MTYIDILHTKIGYKIITSTMLIFTFCMLTAGCDLIEYHPYDGNIDGPTQVNATNIARIHALCDHKDTIRFILMGDTQRWYDETEDFVNHVNQRNDIDFVIHGGDISDFGMKKEFLWIHDIMDDLHVPYVAIIGNHDILGCGDKIFEQLYGNQNYSFIVNRIKFLCLSTNAPFPISITYSPSWQTHATTTGPLLPCMLPPSQSNSIQMPIRNSDISSEDFQASCVACMPTTTRQESQIFTMTASYITVATTLKRKVTFYSR